MSGLQYWADLPNDLLHSIVSLLGTFPDLLAFAATCRSWCAAFSSHPSKSNFSTLLPPLLLQPDVPVCSHRPRPFNNNIIPKRPCYFTDLANQDTYMCCQIPLFACFGNITAPPSPLDSYDFWGASYGHLILSNKKSCLVVDVFTGVSVSTPQLPFDEHSRPYYAYAALTAPPASPHSHLLVTTGSQNFFWLVGSHAWLSCSAHIGILKQVVIFKGQVFGMDYDCRLFIIHLGSMTSKQHLSHPWLVACGDMLLLVGCHRSLPSTGDNFEAFRLDLSRKPAKWLKVEKLENWAIFFSIDERSQPLCCKNPERWGGTSNCIYCYFHDSKNWITFELGKPLQGEASNPSVIIFISRDDVMQPMWVMPSMFCDG
ncbi:hypothetical protein VPH35_134263 [Triticum aestivum]